MGYSHILLIKSGSNLCIIILTWRKNRYKQIPMGVRNYLGHFQEKTNEMFHILELIWA